MRAGRFAATPMRRRYPMRNTTAVCRSVATLAAAVVAAAGCGSEFADSAPDGGPTRFTWPTSVAAFGDGFPRSGDPCRRLGESPATSAYLDHRAILVGCPGSGDSVIAQAIIRGLQGRVVGEADGVTMISVPR